MSTVREFCLHTHCIHPVRTAVTCYGGLGVHRRWKITRIPNLQYLGNDRTWKIRPRFLVVVSKCAPVFSCTLAGKNQAECSVLEVLISQMLASVQSGGFPTAASSTQKKPPARCKSDCWRDKISTSEPIMNQTIFLLDVDAVACQTTLTVANRWAVCPSCPDWPHRLSPHHTMERRLKVFWSDQPPLTAC